MSRAGKFIPGQGRNKTKTESVKATTGASGGGGGGAIRATAEPSKPIPVAGENKLKAGLGRFGKPVEKGQRLTITIVGIVLTALIVGGGGYLFIVMPSLQREAQAQSELARERQADADRQKAADEAAAAQKADKDKLNSAQATIHILSVPSGPDVDLEINGVKGHPSTSPTDLGEGMKVDHDKPIQIKINAPGFEEFTTQEPSLQPDAVKTLGPYVLIPNNGSISLSCELQPVQYILTGPIDPSNPNPPYQRKGTLPAKFETLPEGDYTCTAKYQDWELEPFSLTVHDKQEVQKEIVFPFATIGISSNPSGATVREGRDIRGVTPFTLDHQRPGKHVYSVDLPLFKVERITLDVPDAGNVTKSLNLQTTKDFRNSCGMILVWLDDQGYWVGKYEVTQEEFTKVMGFNPSDLRQPGHPVDSVCWDDADLFCKKLNDQDHAANLLPAGYHYALPSELEWATFNADASLQNSAVSFNQTAFSSTQQVGYSEPNSYGLYDTLGNVQEWCRDLFGEGTSRSIRGGDWLSSIENFPNISSRVGAGETYKDKFTGFRVILEKNQ